MAKLLLDLPNEQKEALKDLSNSTGIPMAHYVRQAIGNFLCSGLMGSISVSGFITPVSGFILVMKGG